MANRFKGAVYDPLTGHALTAYPKKTPSEKKYDLIVQDGDRWYYVGSSNNRHQLSKDHALTKPWRVVNATTGSIMTKGNTQ